MRTRQAFHALDERTRVQRIRSMAFSGIQGKPTGPLALKGCCKAIPNYIVRQRWRVGGESNSFGEVGTPSEARPIGRLKLARKPENYVA
jgi:hypothetical protein